MKNALSRESRQQGSLPIQEQGLQMRQDSGAVSGKPKTTFKTSDRMGPKPFT